MIFKELLKEKNITPYQLAKQTGIPYTTINDVINGKTLICNMRFKHVTQIMDVLDVDIDVIRSITEIETGEFRYFRNNVLMELKRSGATHFIKRLINGKYIDFYYKNNNLECALYLLALLDYLCATNGIPIYDKRYNTLRKMKLDKPFFAGYEWFNFLNMEEVESKLGIKLIPEFKKYNIVEDNIFNVA